METVLSIIVLLTAGATIELWRTAVRRPARPKKAFVKALLNGGAIVPNHGRPERWTHYNEAELAKWKRSRRKLARR
jgi:hypothetical protein